MPCRRATRLTVTSGSCVSATIASFSAGVLRRRRSGPFRTSLFRLLLVIDTTLLLPLSEGGERVRSIKGPLHVPMVCVLWDLSEGGARLSVSNPQEVPDEVSVALRRDERNGTRCRVVWRSNDDIGVQFIQNAEPLL